MRLFFLIACLALPALTALAQSSAAPSKAKTYPQLLSTRYAKGDALPADFRRPDPKYDFVDRTKLPAGATIRSAARAKSGIVWAITDKGGFRIADGKATILQSPRAFKSLQPGINEDTFVTAAAEDKDGHIWAATTRGVYVTDGDQWWQVIDRRDGMPYETMTCIFLAPNGDVWGGTTEGAWRLRDGRFRYFWGKRWLPGNRISAIWSDAKGKVWVETDGGTACIEEKAMTLAEKAAHFEQVTRERHNRRGYIFETHLKVQGKPEKGWFYEASDNDGAWTSPYLAAMSLKYAITKDPVSRQQAKQSMEAMLDLERLSGVPGYPARAVATDQEVKDGIQGIDYNETVRMPGETDKIWYRSPVDPTVWCKGDTSSDEIANHFYMLYVYYDLVADAGEKKRIAAVLKRIMDNMIQGGYNLIGHTGRMTRWGAYAPDLINEDPFWTDQRPLNSLELLSHLKVTAYVTGDPSYERRYEELIAKHHYLVNTLLYRRGYSAEWQNINHSDDALAYVSYYPLIKLEKDPERLRLLKQSLAGTWETTMEENAIPRQRHAFFNFTYGSLSGRPCASEDAVEMLQDWPWEMVFWNCRNSQRHDVVFRVAKGLNNRSELTRVLPASERQQQRCNNDAFEPDGGADGMMEDDGGAWLVGYWLGVYYGYISKDQ